MPRVVGIDPGTVSIDVCGIDDGRLFLDRSFPTGQVLAEPAAFVALLEAGGPLDLVAGPSGYGLPLTPGVVHLPTVPEYRKVNRVDLGTAEKVCAAALAIDEQARRFARPLADVSLVLLELGGAFTAAVAVAGGRIVDGVGGSSGPLGFR